MAINTVNSGTRLVTDYNIEERINFFYELKTYQHFYLNAIDTKIYCLLVPKSFIGFETGDKAWRYDGEWKKVIDNRFDVSSDWKVIKKEVLDVKTI